MRAPVRGVHGRDHLALHLPHRARRVFGDGAAPLAEHARVPSVDDHLGGVRGRPRDHLSRVAAEAQQLYGSVRLQRRAHLAQPVVHEREVAFVGPRKRARPRERGDERLFQRDGSLRGKLQRLVVPRALRGLHPKQDERPGVPRGEEVQATHAVGGDRRGGRRTAISARRAGAERRRIRHEVRGRARRARGRGRGRGQGPPFVT